MIGSDRPGGAGPRELAAALGAALDWWRLAGVDSDYAEAPRNWLAPVATRPRPASAPLAAPAPTAPRLQPPATLAEFRDWWMIAPELGASAARVPGSGPEAPELMVVVPMPEAGDADRGALLSGAAGRLLDGFCAAAGLPRDRITCAAALPARIAAADWHALAEAGFGAVLAHHVALVAPQRLAILGQAPVSTLLGNGSPHIPTGLPTFNHDRGTVPVFWGYNLEAVLARPALKAAWWKRWLDWSGAGETNGVRA